MAGFKHLPSLVEKGGTWTVEPFTPSQPAFRWDEFERKNATLYILQSGGYLKIGVTKDLKKRLRSLEAMNPLPVTLIAKRTMPLAALLITEAWLHQRFADARVKGEWFALSVEEAVGALPEAERFARAYTRCCRDWHARDLARFHTS